MKEIIYYVQGMHCASCELIIEKKLLREKGVRAVEASAGKGELRIEYEGQKPNLSHLNQLFSENHYFFSEKPIKLESKNQTLKALGMALVLILGFIAFNKAGLSDLISVNSASSLPAFFLFGLLAGFSSCAALIGGLILSLSKQWKGPLPHVLFNSGRLLSYLFFGAILGIIGSAFQLSPTFSSLLVFLVSGIMIILGLQMLGIAGLQRFQLTLPKSITRYAADESHFQNRYLPFLMGALTFFLPCGFTLTAQALAIASGNWAQASLIMFSFSLGTLPALLLIGFSAEKLYRQPHLSGVFLKIAGVLVLFFALFNINNQLNVLGFKSLNNLISKTNVSGQTQAEGLAPIVGGKQVLKMDASSQGYQPNYFKVRVGIPVRWEITDRGTSGCTNAVISKGLFDGQIPLTPGQTSVKEFTVAKPGKYKFSCWMGMISGTIEAVDSSGKIDQVSAQETPSGASGCGCGGGNL